MTDPTEEQIEAGAIAFSTYEPVEKDSMVVELVTCIYRAMEAAKPQPLEAGPPKLPQGPVRAGE